MEPQARLPPERMTLGGAGQVWPAKGEAMILAAEQQPQQTTQEFPPFPAETDRRRIDGAMNNLFNALEAAMSGVPDYRLWADAEGDTRDITDAHIAEIATIISNLTCRIGDYQQMLERLRSGLEYLVLGRQEQEARARYARRDQAQALRGG